MDEDIVLAKVDNIQRCLKRIRDKLAGAPDRLDDIDVQDIVVLGLQRAVQSAIDLAVHAVVSDGLGLPAQVRDSFALLERAGVIDAPLARQLERMCGFRNVAVHDYAALDLAIVKTIVRERLPDLERFAARMLEHAGLGAE